MIQLTDPNGIVHHVAPAAIAVVSEAAASSQWHGIKSYVRLFDGQVMECRETANEVLFALTQANGVT